MPIPGYQHKVKCCILLAAVIAYHLTHSYVLGGSGGWDYLAYDATSHRLFVSRATHVIVVDPRTGTIVGNIPNTPGVHGIALAPQLNKGFTSNGGGWNGHRLRSLDPRKTRNR